MAPSHLHAQALTWGLRAGNGSPPPPGVSKATSYHHTCRMRTVTHKAAAHTGRSSQGYSHAWVQSHGGR